MNLKTKSFNIASWSLAFGGLFHSFSDLLSPKTTERIEIMNQMKALTSHILDTEFNMLSFFQGFSLMMGLLTFAYGTINVMLLKSYKDIEIPNNILILNTLVTLVCLILSIQYFFIIPIVLTGIPFLGYLTALIAKKRSKT